MTENAGIDPRTAAAEQETSGDRPAAPDQTMVAEDPTGDLAGAAGAAGDVADAGAAGDVADAGAAAGEPDELH